VPVPFHRLVPKGRAGADGQPGIGARQGGASLTVPPTMAARKVPTIPGRVTIQPRTPPSRGAVSARHLGTGNAAMTGTPAGGAGYRVKA
jgi:hypothetical protein